MKHRFLISTLASVMLATGTGAISTAIAPTHTVQAISKHSWHWHLVKTKRDVKVYKLRFPLYRRPNFDGILAKGSELYIRYMGNNEYYQIKGWGKGQYAVLGKSTSWFRNK